MSNRLIDGLVALSLRQLDRLLQRHDQGGIARQLDVQPDKQARLLHASRSPAKIGLIQTYSIGDIVIAAPIAQHYIDLGHRVFWPVDVQYLRFVQAAFPEIHFLPIEAPQTHSADSLFEFSYTRPLEELQRQECERIFCLYPYAAMTEYRNIVNARLAFSLKFDEYKYAVAKVPFAKKWQLRIARNREREQALFDRLGIRRAYILVHDHCAAGKLDIPIPEDWLRDYQLIRISEMTDNPFDWLGVVEKAAILVCVDSCFANLVEQLDFCAQKYLILRSDTRLTPVFKNNWQFDKFIVSK